VRDCPHVLFEAIRVALMVIGFDELDRDERPPRRNLAGQRPLVRVVQGRRPPPPEKYGGKGPGAIEDPVKTKRRGA
jgi:hypothetical protein